MDRRNQPLPVGGPDVSRSQPAGLGMALLLAVLIGVPSLGACSPREVSESEGISVAGREGIGAFATRSGLAVTGGSRVVDGDGDEDEDDEGRKDYWKDIRFDRANFEEVRQQVKKRYIERTHDEAWGYAQAAVFALASHPDRTLLAFPESFYEVRKDHEDERGALKGKMFKLSPNDRFVLLEESEEKVEEPRKRLSDDEIRALRERSMARTRLLHESWVATGFTGRDFDRVMGFIQREMIATDKWTLRNT